MESHPALSAEGEGVSHCLVGDDIYPCLNIHERRTIVVKLNGYLGLGLC